MTFESPCLRAWSLFISSLTWASCVAYPFRWQPRPDNGVSKSKTPTSFFVSVRIRVSPDYYLDSMRRFLLIVICFLLGTSLFAQQYNKYGSSYNFKKAMEFLESEDADSALGSFRDELKEHKDNGYAYLFIASIQLQNENYGDALSAIENAIKFIPKKIRNTNHLLSINVLEYMWHWRTQKRH